MRELQAMIAPLGALAAAAALVLASAAAPAPLGGAAVAQEADAERIEAGRQLFYDHECYACHGYTGETRIVLVTEQGFTPMLSSEAAFVGYLRLRRDEAGMTPSTDMPYYGEGSLSDEEARAIYAYIRSLNSNTPPLEDIPVLLEILEAAAAGN